MTRNNRKQYTLLAGGFLGAVFSVLFCAAGAALVAYCTLNELLGQQGSEVSVRVSIMLSVMAGGWIAVTTVGEKKMLACILSGAIVMLAILSAALLLDGPFVSAFSTAAAIGIGTILVCVLCMKRQKKQLHRKRAYR